jgi:hypothetical protein
LMIGRSSAKTTWRIGTLFLKMGRVLFIPHSISKTGEQNPEQ